MSEPRRIIVLGGMAQMPYAGVAWQVLHYLEGFRRLGHEVSYVEDTGNWPYDPDRDGWSSDAGPAVRRLEAIMRSHGFGDRWAYRDASRDGGQLGADAPPRRVGGRGLHLDQERRVPQAARRAPQGERHLRPRVRPRRPRDPGQAGALRLAAHRGGPALPGPRPLSRVHPLFDRRAQRRQGPE